MSTRSCTNILSCLFVLFLLFVFVRVFPAGATDYTSTNFILRDPVITNDGGRSASSNFEYFSSTGQTVIGEQTSGSFIGRSGLLYVPQATPPVVTVPVAPSAASSSGGGGGGGGSYVAPPIITQIIFAGRAYPKSTVTILKDAQVAATTVAGADANFSISISGLSAGSYIFSVYTEDPQGNRSSLLTFPVSVTAGATTNVSGIFIAPTIAVDKREVKRGDPIAIFGQSISAAEIIISVASEQEFFAKTKADSSGVYLYNFDTTVLDAGQHFTKSRAALAEAISPSSSAVSFQVGTKTVVVEPAKKCPAKADLNDDCKVNLIDFSILAFWYKRPLSNVFKQIEIGKLNGDGKVNIVDFSIMAYYWTG